MVRGSGLLDALNVRVIGSGERIIVLSHGFGCDQSVWRYILPCLVGEFKVLLFDMAFSGSVDPKHFDMDRYGSSLSGYADDVLCILEELKVEKCVYVGHSVSGMVGCIASIKRPELFEKLVLLCASPRYLNDDSYLGGFELGAIDQLLRAMKSDYSSWVSGFAPLVVGVDDPPVVREFSQKMLSMMPDIALTAARNIFHSDMRCILAEVKTPCGIIQTTKDKAVPMSVPYYLQRNLGGKVVSVDIIETVGHLPQLTSPGLLLQSLKKIIECDL